MPLNLTGCGVISAVSIDMSGPATSPSTAGIGYGMFGYSGVGLGFSSTASGPGQGIAFFTCGDYERMRLTSAGTLMIGASTNNANTDISKIAQLIAPRAQTSYPLTLSTAGLGCTNDEIRMTFNYGSTFSATAYVGSVLENFGTAATGLVFGGYSGGVIERMRITSAGNVGIGSTSPNIMGFTGTMLTINGTGNYQGLELAACGTARMTMLANIEGTLGYISTRQAGMSLIFEAGAASEKMRITCAGNVGIGTSSPNTMLQVAGNFTLSGGTRCIVGDGGDLLIDTENVSGRDIILQSNSGQKVGIGTTSPSYRLHVNGTFYAAGSSQDYKEGICQYNTDSCLFMCLKPKTYQYKDEWKHLGKDLKSETQIGLIAEEVAESHPELAILVNEEDNKVVRNVDYEKLSIILLSEVQKLRQEVDQLKNK
jgi:hypothetical protein